MKQVVYIICILIFMISCNKNNEEKKSEKKDNVVNIKVGYLNEFAGASAIAIAKEKGFFEEENLEVELFEFFNGHAAVLSMISKEIDFAYIGHAAHNLIIEGKAQVLIPNGISKGEKIIASRSSNIKNIKDLKGKTIATHIGTSGEAMLLTVLENAGLSVKDINLLNINITNLENSLINKEVDAISTWDPYTSRIVNNYDYEIIADINDYSNKVILTSSFVSTLEYINSHRETVAKFSRAILKAMDYRRYHLDEAAEFVANLNNKNIEEIEKEEYSSIWLTSEDISNACETGEILKWYETQQKVFFNSEVIKETVPVTNYIQLELLKSILNTL